LNAVAIPSPAGEGDRILADVLTIGDIGLPECRSLLAAFGLSLECVAPGTVIPGSYWGEREAGLVEDRVYCRLDTPVHSLLHEACHSICMDPRRRESLDQDAGGDFDEENAVCWLQIALADHLRGMGSARMMADMDAWGYTIRLGSAAAWFAQDARDAEDWLKAKGLLDAGGAVTWRLRTE
jgi:hypothetical protein